MKIIVAVKQVLDYAAVLRLNSSHTAVLTEHVASIMNPFDEIALEAAIKLYEQGHCEEIICIAIGSATWHGVLRKALAMGATRAILITTENTMMPLSIAKILKLLVAREQAQLVLLGKQAIDSDDNQVPQMLAGLLGWSQATFASEITLVGTNILVSREVDSGLQRLQLNLPAIISVDLRLNTPRNLSLMQIMQAKQKKIEEISLDSLSLTLTNNSKIVKLEINDKKRDGITVKNATELVKYLHEVERVI